ncbi:MAG: OmpA family protein [Gammaproteobacteria bacterium]|jgi:peptidoglycan-associated lipoprotein
MTKRKLRVIENLILLTFPVTLFVGCAGSDIKPTAAQAPETNHTSSYASYDNPLPEDELTDISIAYTMEGENSQTNNDTAAYEHPVRPAVFKTESDVIGDESGNTTGMTNTEQGTMEDRLSAMDATMDTALETASGLGEADSNRVIRPDLNIIHFDTDKYQLLEAQRDNLKQHAEYLIANPQFTMVINGHADERGTRRYNQSLSENRAQAVYQLMVKLGVPEKQLVKKGFGETKPLHNTTNWAENRRVELEFQNPVIVSGM